MKIANWFLNFLEKRGRKRILFDRNGNEYMHRYYLLFKEKQNAFEDVKPYPNVFLHKIILSDSDHLHDHPWNYVTIILKGGYWEWAPATKDGKKEFEYARWCGPGTILTRRATQYHRLELEKPMWSLFFHGFRFREWGFFVNNKWIDRKEYILEKNK